MFEKILIANRGEIACRIIKTARRLGIITVAIYSEADHNSQHVQQADEAYCVGPAPSQQSYLNIAAIIKIAKEAKVAAIHPGYGFLSENEEFATACNQADIIFIGPTAAAIKAMGSKSAAKNIMQQANVPVIPGYHGNDQSSETLLAAARQIGFPVLIKAVAGGGGKGMRSVLQENQFLEALTGAKREAKASFNDDTILIEKLILQPRHIEFQIFADNFGNTVYLFERDCSIQRRHQKVIEEAPALNLTHQLRERMGKAAVTAASAIDYRGAGTIEFLLDKEQNFYFMEMNTRLQVEHPVTEMITGLDLVEWQLKVAANEPLPLMQEQLSLTGHAIETRIYAEDPQHNFMPSTGTIKYLHLPTQQHNVRIDCGITQGDNVSIYYDPMLAKLICWANTRDLAVQFMQRALADFQILGIHSNIDFLKAILRHPYFIQGKISTDFIQQHQAELLEKKDYHLHQIILLACLYLLKSNDAASSAWSDNSGWQVNLPAQQRFEFLVDQQKVCAIVNKLKSSFEITIDDTNFQISGEYKNDRLVVYYANLRISATIQQHDQEIFIMIDNHGAHIVEIFNPETLYSKEAYQLGQLTAPMPGTVVAVNVAAGQNVVAGDSLMVIEAMKMEHTIHAPSDGIITDVHYQVGQQVNEGDELLALDISTE